MTQIGRFQTRVATARAATLIDQHGVRALQIANLDLAQAVRAGDEAEMNLLCEACLILLRLVPHDVPATLLTEDAGLRGSAIPH